MIAIIIYIWLNRLHLTSCEWMNDYDDYEDDNDGTFGAHNFMK